MMRFIGSLIVGLVIGAMIGVILGWGIFARTPVDVAPEMLATRYQEEYLLMVAGGYWEDADILGAFERLQILNLENIPQFVRTVTEKFISTSRSFEEIQILVALSEGFGQLTEIMRPYRQVNTP